MIEPRIIIKANHDRTSITIRVTAIDSPDWVDIVGARIELSRDSSFSNIFYTNSTTHYKVRAYLDDEAPNQTIYGRVTLTKEDNTTLVKTFNFITPYPVLGTVKDEGNTQYITSLRKMDKNGNLSPRNYSNRATTDAPAHIDIMADETGEMIIANQWTTPILVQNITQNTAQVEVAGGNRTNQATIAVNEGDIVRVLESDEDKTFRRFTSNGSDGLCRGVSAHITVMPPMERFAKYSDGRIMPDYFFYCFNRNGTLTSLPEGSFDIHRVIYAETGQTYSYGIFGYFNYSGALTSLPEGSFDTSNIKDSSQSDYYYTNQYGRRGRANYIQLSHYSFLGFNHLGALTSLPEGSFDFDNLKSVNGSSILTGFNNNGALTSLPEGSFGFSSYANANNRITSGLDLGDFNRNGRLTSLPAGSFHFKKNSILVANSFVRFNYEGSLTSLPEHSFNFVIRQSGFNYFNYKGGITSLPEGSFRFTTNEEVTPSDDAFRSFNELGALTSLPEGSFNTEMMRSLGAGSFTDFNKSGALTSLPEGSFNFENVTTTGKYSVCAGFNKNGALKSLPKGSFNFKSLTSAGYSFCAEFNRGGALEYLPIDSFSVNNITSIFQTTSDSWQAFWYFNYGGKLTKSDTDYNPNHIFPTPAQPASLDAYYYDPSTQTQTVETISRGNPFKYYQADYFSVTYTPSQAYTTDLANEYLSGQTITFTASAIDPEYMVTPTITTDGGTTVTFTDNGDDTFTFVMPQDNINVTFAVALRPATITLVADEAGTMMIGNKWSTPILVTNVTQGTTPVTVVSNSTTSIGVNADDEITVTEGSASVTFRTWNTRYDYFAAGVLCHISEMPEMDRFTTTKTSNKLGAGAFFCFCTSSNGKGITSLPTGSFDTSSITSCASNVFTGFNQRGLITSLPTGSFNFGNFTSVSTSFCASFNEEGALTSLPADSFNIDNIVITTSQPTSAFFSRFNYKGALTSLPAGSFDISNYTYLDYACFAHFNYQGALVSLPAGSFDTGNITQIGTGSYYPKAFMSFNEGGELTSLPNGSFNFDNLEDVPRWNYSGTHQPQGFCTYFNRNGKLTSLPAGSFAFPKMTAADETYFCAYFNFNGALTSLPAGSFNISNMTRVDQGFFANFNEQGKLTSLPAGSFDTSNITDSGRGSYFYRFNNGGELTSLPAGSFVINSSMTTVGDSFFAGFNGGGKLTSLPAGSFDISHITTVGSSFFGYFNFSGKLTSLPAGSFNTSNITTVGGDFFSMFTRAGVLATLPAGSFDISNITTAPNGFFNTFNYQGHLTSFPAGSFDTSNITTAGNSVFEGFIGETKGKITTPLELPAGSFRFDSLTSVGSGFCSNFNALGKLTSLPAGSFNIDNITTAGNSFFSGFNASGNLTSLPAGSFDTSNLTSVGETAFASFNDFGELTSLPTGSFNTTNLTSIGTGTTFAHNFNYQGKLVKDTTSYNPDFINPTTSNDIAYYYPNNTQETITPGSPFYYKTA